LVPLIRGARFCAGPRRILAWGIDSDSFDLTARDVASTAVAS
jgi:hypothetical protein